MRLIQYSLIAMTVVAALAISVLLVLRNFPAGPQPPRQETAAPIESTPAQEYMAPEENTDPQESNAPDVASAPDAASAAPDISSAAETVTMQKGAFEPTALPPAGSIVGVSPEKPEEESGDISESRLPGGARLTLSGDQESKLRQVLLSHNILQTEAGDFSLRPGGIVPKNVQLTPLPVEVADIVPNFRFYSYVFAQNRIVIVVTDRREIGLVLSM